LGAIREFIGNFGILLVIVILAIVFTIQRPVFLTEGNLANIGRQVTLLLIGAFAMTFVILSGEIDISVGAIASLCGVVIATLLADGQPIPVALAGGATVGAGIGLVNGLIVVKGRIPSFIVTLGMLSIIRGLALASTNASTIVFRNNPYRDLFAREEFLGIPAPVWWAILIFLVLHFLLTRTRFGANVYAVGGNANSARLAGIAVDRVKILVFVLAGLLMACVAVITSARVGNGQPEGSIGLELDAIAAVVLGGTSLSGGRGSLIRTIFGALLIGILNNGLSLNNVEFQVQQVVKGVVIVLAVLLDIWIRGGNRR
jgi:ribose/xylose/arabinose/galactoside ABC-type transport system permease subunit